MQSKELKFTGKNVTFYSPIDEDVFSQWIKKINVITKVEKSANDIIFYMKGNEISKQDLDKLVGLFARYNIDTKQLKIFLNEKNEVWLKYWV